MALAWIDVSEDLMASNDKKCYEVHISENFTCGTKGTKTSNTSSTSSDDHIGFDLNIYDDLVDIIPPPHPMKVLKQNKKVQVSGIFGRYINFEGGDDDDKLKSHRILVIWRETRVQQSKIPMYENSNSRL